MRMISTRLAFLLCCFLSLVLPMGVQGQCTLAATAAVTDETCAGFFDGAIDLTVTGASGVATFSWSTGDFTEDLVSISSGTFIVTVTDQGGCTFIDSFVVSVAHAITVDLGPDTTLCVISNYVLSPNAPGATFYFWQDNSQASTYLANGPGSFNVFVQNSFGCYASDTITLSQYPLPGISLASTQPGCGATLGALNLTPTGGTLPYVYNWSTGSTNQDLANLAPGTYYVSMTDGNDCEVISNGMILPPSDLSRFSVDSTLACSTDSIRFFSHTYGFLVDGVNDYFELPDNPVVHPVGEFSLEVWAKPSGTIGAPQVIVEKRIVSNDGVSVTYDPITRHVIARVQNGPYFVAIASDTTLNLGEWSQISLVVDSVYTSLYIDGLLDQRVAYVHGASAVPATSWFVGGAPNRVRFKGTIDEVRLWNVPLTADQVMEFGRRTIPDGHPALSMYFNFDQAPGSSTAMDRSPNNMLGHFVNADTQAVWVSSNPLALGFLWSFGDATVNNSQTPIHNYQDNIWINANVTLTVTSTGGCQSVDSLVLPVHTPANPFIRQSFDGPYCIGDSLILSVASNYVSYQWMPGGTNDSLLVVGSGNYGITADDGNGCIHTDSLELRFNLNTVPNPVISPSGTSGICEGDTLILNAGAGYSLYQWSSGQMTQTISVADSGDFIVVVTDGFGCSRRSDTATVVVLPASTASINQSNDTLYATPGSSYQWYLNGTAILGAIGNSYVPIVSGSYTVRVGSPGHCDALSAPFSFLVGLAEGDFLGESVIFPNPTVGDVALHLYMRRPGPVSMQLMDLRGHVIWQQEIRGAEGENRIPLSTANLPGGTYLLKTQGRDGQFTKLITKI